TKVLKDLLPRVNATTFALKETSWRGRRGKVRSAGLEEYSDSTAAASSSSSAKILSFANGCDSNSRSVYKVGAVNTRPYQIFFHLPDERYAYVPEDIKSNLCKKVQNGINVIRKKGGTGVKLLPKLSSVSTFFGSKDDVVFEIKSPSY